MIPNINPRVIVLIAGLCSIPAPATGQGLYDPRVYPEPKFAGQVLRLWAPLPEMSCFNDLKIEGTTISGNEVTLSYSVVPGPARVCFTVSPPLVMDDAFGTFASGDYILRAVDSAPMNPNPPIVVPFTVLPAPPPVLVNDEGLWWNVPAGSEAGWGINLAHQGDLIFATWFTYDLTGKAWWLVMTAAKTADNIYQGALYQTNGPAFDGPTFPPIGSPGGTTGSIVGSATLTFSDANNATFAYTVNGISQTKTITHQQFGPLPNCTFGVVPNIRLATNYQDLWWSETPAGEFESGWGINLTHQGDTIVGTWFTYDHDRTPMWLVVTASKIAGELYPGDLYAGKKYSGDLYRTTGPPFNSVPFPPIGSPGGVMGSIVGTARFTFFDGNSAGFSYTLNGVETTKVITRELLVAPGTVCQ
jgi:hypothetical protein